MAKCGVRRGRCVFHEPATNRWLHGVSIPADSRCSIEVSTHKKYHVDLSHGFLKEEGLSSG